ncbi:hypothetical protein [Klebsiella pneumoniae IS46]|nr:hypothetical protein [Klebsiella pneumoniae IS10]CDL17483.1 hypothetical protein [Klebsiella pneumoniae IS46]
MAPHRAGFTLQRLNIISVGIHFTPLNLFSAWNIYSSKD